MRWKLIDHRIFDVLTAEAIRQHGPELPVRNVEHVDVDERSVDLDESVALELHAGGRDYAPDGVASPHPLSRDAGTQAHEVRDNVHCEAGRAERRRGENQCGGSEQISQRLSSSCEHDPSLPVELSRTQYTAGSTCALWSPRCFDRIEIDVADKRSYHCVHNDHLYESAICRRYMRGGLL